MSLQQHLSQVAHYNARTLQKAPLAELSGSLGDLGTLLPLMIAMALQGSIDLSTTLVFSGVTNILTGFVFGVPLPVSALERPRISMYLTNSHKGTTYESDRRCCDQSEVQQRRDGCRWPDYGQYVYAPMPRRMQLSTGLIHLFATCSRSVRIECDWLTGLVTPGRTCPSRQRYTSRSWSISCHQCRIEYDPTLSVDDTGLR